MLPLDHSRRQQPKAMTQAQGNHGAPELAAGDSTGSRDRTRWQCEVAGHRLKLGPAPATALDWSAARARAPVQAELAGLPVTLQISELQSEYGQWARLDLAALGSWAIDAQAGTVHRLRAAASDALAMQALDGPVLLHFLAARGVFVLHASAVAANHGAAIALCAPSGRGKSTLARAAQTLGLVRLCDDLSPLTVDRAGRPWIHPHFVQPKLAAAEQYCGDAPAVLPLSALVAVGRGAKAALNPADPRQAFDWILRSTLGHRVFSSAALKQHLGFAKRLADAVARGELAALELTVAERAANVDAAAREALGLLLADVAD